MPNPPYAGAHLQLLHQAVGDVATGRLTGADDLHNLWEQAELGGALREREEDGITRGVSGTNNFQRA